MFTISFSQQFSPSGINCFDAGVPIMCYDNNFLGGQCKPESIERYTNDPDAVFRVLVVYVQLQSDPYPNATHWPVGQEPAFIGNLLAENKQINTEWWNTYNEATARMSDYWMEVSRGKLHVIGSEVHKKLPHDNEWYEQNGGTAKAMDDLYDLLANDVSINWPLYDKWSKNGNDFIYSPQGDGYIDMIYFIFRSQTNIIGIPNARMSDCSHEEHIIYNIGGVI